MFNKTSIKRLCSGDLKKCNIILQNFEKNEVHNKNRNKKRKIINEVKNTINLDLNKNLIVDNYFISDHKRDKFRKITNNKIIKIKDSNTIRNLRKITFNDYKEDYTFLETPNEYLIKNNKKIYKKNSLLIYNIKNNNDNDLIKKILKIKFENSEIFSTNDKNIKTYMNSKTIINQTEINNLKFIFKIREISAKIFYFNSTSIDGIGFIQSYSSCIKKTFKKYENFISEEKWKDITKDITIGIAECEDGGTLVGFGCRISIFSTNSNNNIFLKENKRILGDLYRINLPENYKRSFSERINQNRSTLSNIEVEIYHIKRNIKVTLIFKCADGKLSCNFFLKKLIILKFNFYF
jgi:hypothetical protein